MGEPVSSSTFSRVSRLEDPSLLLPHAHPGVVLERALVAVTVGMKLDAVRESQRDELKVYSK